MTKRYPQTCPVARAAEIVGERWTLLIVRELLLGPKRFRALRKRLSGVSSSVLTQRLDALEERGVIQRRDHPPPVSAMVYELTEAGQALQPVIASLARWGLRYFFPPHPEEHFEPDWMRQSLGIFARQSSSPALHFAVVVQVGERDFCFDVVGGEQGTQVRETGFRETGFRETGFRETESQAKERLFVDASLLPMLMAGFVDLDQARASGALVTEGEEAKLREFPALFEMDFGEVEPEQIRSAMAAHPPMALRTQSGKPKSKI